MSSGKANPHQPRGGIQRRFSKTTLRMTDGRGAQLLSDTAIPVAGRRCGHIHDVKDRPALTLAGELPDRLPGWKPVEHSRNILRKVKRGSDQRCASFERLRMRCFSSCRQNCSSSRACRRTQVSHAADDVRRRRVLLSTRGDHSGISRAFPEGRIAQLVEQLTLNQRVAGSSPAAPTIKFLDGRKPYDGFTVRARPFAGCLNTPPFSPWHMTYALRAQPGGSRAAGSSRFSPSLDSRRVT